MLETWVSTLYYFFLYAENFSDSSPPSYNINDNDGITILYENGTLKTKGLQWKSVRIAIRIETHSKRYDKNRQNQ